MTNIHLKEATGVEFGNLILSLTVFGRFVREMVEFYLLHTSLALVGRNELTKISPC